MFCQCQDFNEIRCLTEVFPKSRILLCVFHTLKWMKSVFASALVETSKKQDMMTIFRMLVYAPGRTVFEEKLLEWYEAIKGVEVKPTKGEKGTWVSLTDYYQKNWAPVVDMWAKHKRRGLAIGDTHTNNRLEAEFKVLKDYLHQFNLGKVSVDRTVLQLVRLAEEKLVTRYTLHSLTPFFMKLYKKAAENLNKLRCLNFRENVGKWKAKVGKMSIEDGGIKETSQNKGDKIHQFQILHTTENSCTCIWSETIYVPVDTISLFAVETVFFFFGKKSFK